MLLSGQGILTKIEEPYLSKKTQKYIYTFEIMGLDKQSSIRVSSDFPLEPKLQQLHFPFVDFKIKHHTGVSKDGKPYVINTLTDLKLTENK